MKGSAKGRYGLQFMVALALQAGRGPVLVEAVAQAEGLPPKFLRVLLGPLKAAGLLKVQRGPSGGCELARHPSRITALEVLEALEGRLGAAPLEPDAGPGTLAVRDLWTQATQAARAVLRHATLADLADRHRTLSAGGAHYDI